VGQVIIERPVRFGLRGCALRIDGVAGLSRAKTCYAPNAIARPGRLASRIARRRPNAHRGPNRDRSVAGAGRYLGNRLKSYCAIVIRARAVLEILQCPHVHYGFYALATPARCTFQTVSRRRQLYRLFIGASSLADRPAVSMEYDPGQAILVSVRKQRR